MNKFISKHLLMRCGIQPTEIDNMPFEEVIYFSFFYKEMKENENKSIARELAKVMSKMFGG